MESIMSGAPGVDVLLEQWAERGFNQSPVRKPRAKRGLTGLSLKANSQAAAPRASAAGVRAKVGCITRRTPQVMVRISGGGRGMRHIRAHLAYITRNGRLAAIDQNEDRHRGREELADLGLELQSGGFPIAESSDRREAFNIILSMPEGTDSIGVRRAAIRFAADEFQGHQYALVLHSHDTDPHKDPARHPHVHLCVKATREDGVRLNPRKQDLQRWRERFAQRLREHGIDAAASNRLERLQRQRGQKQSVLHKQARGEPMHSIGGARPAGEQLARAQRLETAMLARYQELAHILARSDDTRDRGLATSLGPVLRDRRDNLRRTRTASDRQLDEERRT
jgi:hypothetical protein